MDHLQDWYRGYFFRFLPRPGKLRMERNFLTLRLAGLLLLQLKRIGDAVLTAPALGALRAAYPDERLTLVLAGAAGELSTCFAMVDEVLRWQPGRLNAGVLHRVRALQPQVVLDYTGTDRSALLALASGAGVRAGYGKFAGSWFRQAACPELCRANVRNSHTIDFHHALARAAGLQVPAVPDAGHLVRPDGLPVPGLPDRYAVIHPGTARVEKFWPAAAWAALLDQLHARHALPLVLTGGNWEPEQQHVREILAATTAPVMNLQGRLGLAQLAGVIAKAHLALTVDTGAMHLAASWQIPQVALFGPTNPFHWGPRHSQAVVLQAGVKPGAALDPQQKGAAMGHLPWEAVLDAVEGLLGQGSA